MPVVVEDLPSLLGDGERAVFRGAPGAAVHDLERAAAQAHADGRPAAASAAGWLLGVALSAVGRYGPALAALLPLLDAGERAGADSETQLFGSLAASAAAGVQRALGRHDVAHSLDLRGLSLTGTGEAGLGCVVGLATDAVGSDDREQACEWLATAEQMAAGHGDEWWRQLLRLEWARCEVSLLLGDAEEAGQHAIAAVRRAEAARSPRHLAKSLLFLAVVQLQTGADAAATLRRSAMLADSVGALPVLWQAKALFGALVIDEDEEVGEVALAGARSAVLAMAADLPAELREQWLSRPNVAALLEG